MSPETIGSVAVSLITGGSAVWAARSARRTPRQERRDDFTAITTQQSAAIQRLEARAERQEAESERQQQQIGDQDQAISWLVDRVRDLVAYIRRSGLEPPAADPVPARARKYVDYLDV